QESLERQLVTLQVNSLVETSRRQYKITLNQWCKFSARIGWRRNYHEISPIYSLFGWLSLLSTHGTPTETPNPNQRDISKAKSAISSGSTECLLDLHRTSMKPTQQH
ncbi:hypothetical protein L915_07954, partial [Phytophthora nicotianae]